MRKMRNAYKMSENLKEREHSGDVGVNESIILKLILKNKICRYI